MSDSGQKITPGRLNIPIFDGLPDIPAVVHTPEVLEFYLVTKSDFESYRFARGLEVTFSGAAVSAFTCLLGWGGSWLGAGLSNDYKPLFAAVAIVLFAVCVLCFVLFLVARKHRATKEEAIVSRLESQTQRLT